MRPVKNDACDLTAMKCVPCRDGTGLLTRELALKLFDSLKEKSCWSLTIGGTTTAAYAELKRSYAFRDFKEAVAFVRKLARVADANDHHPDVSITGYRLVTLSFATHSAKGLTLNDFILAAKCDAIRERMAKVPAKPDSTAR